MKYGGMEYPDSIYCGRCKEMRDVKDQFPTVKITKNFSQMAFFQCQVCKGAMPAPKKLR